MVGDHYPADRCTAYQLPVSRCWSVTTSDGTADAVTRDEMERRPWELWQWREFLPVRRRENVVSLGETATPLLAIPATVGDGPVLVKDEGRLPTGSFTSTRDGGGGLNGQRAGLDGPGDGIEWERRRGSRRLRLASGDGDLHLLPPTTHPRSMCARSSYRGGHVWTVNGQIDQCGVLVAAGKEPIGWFDVSTLKEPYRIEGKKTVGLELALQVAWDLPDVIFYPTGGGTGLIGMWKAFNELRALGWIDRMPRMVAVQSTGCAPMVKAWQEGR